MFRVVVVGLLFVISSCASVVDDRTVEEVYRDRVAELGLVPVYPPREDVRVGDVFFFSHDGDVRNARLMLVETIDSRALVQDFLQGIPAYVETELQDSQIKTSQTDISQRNGIQTRAEQEVNTLPVAAFPDITGVSARSFGIGASGAGGILGLSQRSSVYETLSFQSVRTYAADPGSLWVRLQSRLRQQDPACVAYRVSQNRPVVVIDPQSSESVNLCSVRANHIRLGINLLRATERSANFSNPCGNNMICGVFIVSRLYLTRQIEYTYSGAEVNELSLQIASTRQQVANTPDQTPPSVVVLQPESDSTDLESLLKQLGESLSEKSGDTGNGLSGLSVDGRGISFTQIYPRPLVIAWEGLSFTFGSNELDPILSSMNFN